MRTFDLHYHANVFRSSRSNRRNRLAGHRKTLRDNAIDFVASTEHGYKGPMDAYLSLSAATEDIDTFIIPGVEAISSEGADIIFLFRTEDHLRNGLKALTPFAWSVWDSGALGRDLGAITIIPHPLTPGRSGIVTVAGEMGLSRLLAECDYVEAHNGSSILLLNAFSRKKKKETARLQFLRRREFYRKIAYTFELPKHFQTEDIGLAVSSDAHFPGQQLIVGGIEVEESPDFDWFEFLKQRVRFAWYATDLMSRKNRPVVRYAELTRAAFCVLGESIRKRLEANGAGPGRRRRASRRRKALAG